MRKSVLVGDPDCIRVCTLNFQIVALTSKNGETKILPEKMPGVGILTEEIGIHDARTVLQARGP